MSTPQAPLPETPQPRPPRLDGADPLLRIAVREVSVRPSTIVMRQGEVPRGAHLLVSGLACRYRLLPNGSRQITALAVPGDLYDLDVVLLGQAHCFAETLTPCVLAEIPGSEIDDAEGRDPELRRIFRRQLLRNEAITREWMTGMGRRSAKERLAHLFCELSVRLEKTGRVIDQTYSLVLTQATLADMLGLSAVHVNRTLQQLRDERLIDFNGKVLHLHDRAALEQLAAFDAAYLEGV